MYPNLFYKALNMPNNIYNVGQNTNTTTIQPPSTIPVGNEPKPSQVGVFTNKALNILENNKPPENIVDPNAVKEAMGKTQTYMSNPSTIPYDKMTSNADYINQQYDAQKTSLIEASACIGGNTWGFSLYIDNVTAIEIDDNNYTSLVHNMETIGATVNTVKDNFVRVKDTGKWDIVFYDPFSPPFTEGQVIEENLGLFGTHRIFFSKFN
jgi:hypothetical protein